VEKGLLQKQKSAAALFCIGTRKSEELKSSCFQRDFTPLLWNLAALFIMAI